MGKLTDLTDAITTKDAAKTQELALESLVEEETQKRVMDIFQKLMDEDDEDD